MGPEPSTKPSPTAPENGHHDHVHSKEVSSTFASSSSRKRRLGQIDFVYPLAPSLHTTSVQPQPAHQLTHSRPFDAPKPYIFTLLRPELKQRNGVKAPQNQEEKDEVPTNIKRTNESLDDILFGKTSKKQRKEGEESPTDTDKKIKESQTQNGDQRIAEKTRNTEKSRQVTESEATDDSSGGHLSGLSVEDVIKDKWGCRPRANSTDGELNLPQRGLCDERTVLEVYQWKHAVRSRDPNSSNTLSLSLHTPPKGFVNLGNTCFLNSTLQCLAHIPPFCQSLISLPTLRQQSTTSALAHSPYKPKLSMGKKITLRLRSLFQQVYVTKHQTNNGAIAPQGIVKSVPFLGSIGSRLGSGYKFRPGRQEDAHEFLVHLLDAMHDGELKEAGINQEVSGWRDRLPIARLDETTLIHRIFGGYFRSQVKCTRCGHCSNTYDPFLDLSLEVSRKSVQSVESAIREFTKKETLDSENRWKCSGCKKKVCATKQLTVFRPPLSLCIQLKRFTYSGFGGSFGGFNHFGFGGGGGGGKKISKPIEFPAHLSLPLSDGRSCEYSLMGLVIHVGGSASSGHYTACVKKPGRNGQDHWFHVDDSFVEPISEKTVLRQNHAYVLFYSRREVKLEFPNPPLRGSMTAEEATEAGRKRARARSESFQDSYERSTRLQFPKPAGTSDPWHSNLLTGTKKAEEDTQIRKTGPEENRESVGRSDESSPGTLDSSDGSDDAKGEMKQKEYPATQLNGIKPRLPKQASVVLDRGHGGGKVEVVIGPRDKSKSWKPVSTISSHADGYGLLGNRPVNPWGDEDSDEPSTVNKNKPERDRSSVLLAMKRDEKRRKRSTHVDSWDARLDQGKVSLQLTGVCFVVHAILKL